MPKRSLALALLCVALCTTAQAVASDPAAEALFEEGRALLDEGKVDAACGKLAASQKLEPRSGTLISLGYCHEQQGKTATAWGEYRAAVALARDEDRPDFADNAQQFAEAIEPKLSRLTLIIPPSQLDLVAVTLDGAPVDRGAFGTALPVDPGKHELLAAAPGYEPWRGTVTVGALSDRKRIAIPELALAEAAPPPMTDDPFQTTGPRPKPSPMPQPDQVEGGGIPTWTWVVGGLGLASLAVSGAFLGDQLSAAGTLDDRCGPERNACPLDYDFSGDRSREKRGNILFLTFGVAGLVGVGAAAIGMIAAPSAPESEQAVRLTPVLGVGVGAVALDGRF
jgi:hypothetical protein